MAVNRPSESSPGISLGLGTGGRAAGFERVDTGPTMKTRARIMVGLAFLLALPALLLGSLRAAVATDDVRVFTEVNEVADNARTFELRVQAARTSLWAFEAERNIDTGRRLRSTLDGVARAVLELDRKLSALRESEAFATELSTWREELNQEPLLAREAPLARMRGAVGRVRRNVDPIIDDRQADAGTAALRRAHTALETLSRDAATLSRHARDLTRERAAQAETTVSLVGRDQIVLFLLMLFAAPLFLGVAPGWMIAPLVRLRGVAQRVERGRVKDVVATGRDEVGDVTRALRSALKRLDEQDHMQRSKIFELRRVLRATIAPVNEAIVIIGRGGKVDYANPAAGALLGRELHHIENTPFEELMHSPELAEAIKRAREGDVEDKGLEVMVETDIRVERVHADLTPVRSQEGNVTRVVVVLKR